MNLKIADLQERWRRLDLLSYQIYLHLRYKIHQKIIQSKGCKVLLEFKEMSTEKIGKQINKGIKLTTNLTELMRQGKAS